MEIEPMNSWPYYEYGRMLRDYVGDYEEAEKYLMKAMECIDEDVGVVFGAYGYLLYLMGDYERGMKHIERALELDNGDKLTHFYYGVLNKVLGNDEIAERELVKAAGLIKDKEDMMEYLKVLRKGDALNVAYYEKFEEMIMCM